MTLQFGGVTPFALDILPEKLVGSSLPVTGKIGHVACLKSVPQPA